MIGAAVTVGWIAVTRSYSLRLQVRGARDRRIEVVHFKPEQDAVSMCQVGVADGTVMVLHIPGVQLKDELAVQNEPLILRASMPTLTPEQILIPATAGLNIAHANQWLWTHMKSLAEGRKYRERFIKIKYPSRDIRLRQVVGPAGLDSRKGAACDARQNASIA
jgi:hypothetical protein